jgi:hypothetical protein
MLNLGSRKFQPDKFATVSVKVGSGLQYARPVTPLSRYCARPLGREGLQLGFAAVDSKEIRRGVRDLSHTLEREFKKPTPI